MNVRELIKKYNVKPKRSAGQNFLINPEPLHQIVKAAELTDQDDVLEIGPGLGVLTEELLPRVKRVVTVELDRSLIYVLKKQFKRAENLTIINNDVLKLPIEEIVDNFEGEKYKIVANIPYNITSHFLRKFLEHDLRPTKMVLLVQKEVAERVVAEPGKMSLLALSVQLFAKPRIVTIVGAKSFFPAPKVDSAVLDLEVTGPRFEVDQKRFFQLSKIGFSAKRKQLKNNLSAGLRISSDEIGQKLQELGLKETVRAQELSVENWADLTKKLPI
ncbi:ribosomal RNA small subunit methyltransferase A [Candidatus Falkowbacteria bacterium CG10_big_fil_rev_8_21_14_0_10_39_11]|uniref:Ribosomal RNA small subunit methyltransferase A n=1 Tax=Candidatus Falkowbacteria bacterium CG10_big_fil_rev_8_21_14_0_10_39_11 TaxID=1974565 RepID=A0A2H0V554_9BACT|nr:MAG: ribosomal RNA small subunit methyltransferase A [Candidatus Falkowbacteria bacterium CG10_big_fil_rev_8_21_14_0_10_39_11]